VAPTFPGDSSLASPTSHAIVYGISYENQVTSGDIGIGFSVSVSDADMFVDHTSVVVPFDSTAREISRAVLDAMVNVHGFSAKNVILTQLS
jgi:hypothetical protein